MINPYHKIALFEKKQIRERAIQLDRYSVILIGGGRVSYDFIEYFKKENIKFLAIDHDPETIEQLTKQGIACEYGDASDPDFLEDMKLKEADFVISTSPELETNHVVLSVAKRSSKAPLVWVVAHSVSNALELYNAKADYVILPHFLGGKYAASLFKRHTTGTVEIEDVREKQIELLKDRQISGHEHPQVERFL